MSKSVFLSEAIFYLVENSRRGFLSGTHRQSTTESSLVGTLIPNNFAGFIDVVALLTLGFQARNDSGDAVTKLTTVVIAGSDYQLASLVNVTGFVIDLDGRESVF